MADQLYFSGTVDGEAGLFRINAAGGVQRMDLPPGIVAATIRKAGGDGAFFTARDGNGATVVLQVEAAGHLVQVTDNAGVPLFADNAHQVVVEGDAVYWNGLFGDVQAIWKRAADGTVVQVTSALDAGDLFEFSAGRLWVSANSSLNAPDGQAHTAAFAVTDAGVIERMAELRTSRFAPTDDDPFNFDIVDATVKESYEVGGNIAYTFDADSGAALISNSERLTLIAPDGTLISAGETNIEHIANGDIFSIINNVFTDDRNFYAQTAGATGANEVSTSLPRFAQGNSLAFFNGLGHVSVDSRILQIAANGAQTDLFDPNDFRLVTALGAFGNTLYFGARENGVGDPGLELYKFENGAVSLAFNLTPGQAGSFIQEFLGVFDTGDAGGTFLIFTPADSGTSGDDVIQGTNGPDVLDGLGGNDQIFGNLGDDDLTGGAGDDLLDGGSGQDTMRGGPGDDRYIFDDSGDVIEENPGEGTDTVFADRSIFGLPDNVENLEVNRAINAIGNDLNNIITGSEFFQNISGLGGDDRIDGGLGEDVIDGGAGDDVLDGGVGAFRDKLIGAGGDDIIIGQGGGDRIFGNAGDDLLDAGAGDDVVAGQFGDDKAGGHGGDDRIDGGPGDDILFGGLGDDFLIGGGDNDRLHGQDGNDLLFGNAGRDILFGDAGGDFLAGQSGDDILFGGAGADEFFVTSFDGADVVRDFNTALPDGDVVNATRLGFATAADALASIQDDAAGDAVLQTGGLTLTFRGVATAGLKETHFIVDANGPVGGVDDDTLAGTADNDVMLGHGGGDDMRAGDGVDAVYGGDGDDFTAGGGGDDLLRGGAGDDKAFGNAGDDRIIGGDGDDLLVGQSGNDLLAGAAGNDILRGGFGADVLIGNVGVDLLQGDDGDDVLNGGLDGDRYIGGAGADRFVVGAGADVIDDFAAGAGVIDVLDLRSLGFADFNAVLAATTQNAFGALIQLSATNTINLIGVAKADLVADDVLI